ncbi:hypothetical protein FGIG_03988 [Fasciola gigantica]|uniref:Peptidase A2 domain-containing protein n=1 Tax=Fasciola gigantica TaxID=46835 RepID=A0A504YVJ0_FASGI|nr:hypothetical protein FGIG_03988 [Fasciola gigantica]
MVSVRLAGKYGELLLDTGAACSLINVAWLGGKWSAGWEPQGIVEMLCCVDGKLLETVGAFTLKLLMGGMSYTHKFVVIRGMALSVIMGVVILSVLHCAIDRDHNFLRTPRGTVRFLPAKSSPDGGINNLLRSVDAPECIRNKLAALVKDYTVILAWDGTTVGRAGLIRHSINISQTQPIKMHARKIPPCYEATVKNMIHEMSTSNIIQPSKSPWAAPVFLVKKDDGLRLCVDDRRPNQIMEKDSLPLPRMDDMLEALRGSK